MKFCWTLLWVALALTACTPDNTAIPPIETDGQSGDSTPGDLVLAGDDPVAGDSPSDSGGDTYEDGDSPGPSSTAPIFIRGFAVAYGEATAADGGDFWIDLTVADVDRLPDPWRLVSASSSFLDEQLRSTNLPFVLADGDIIRVHGADYDGATDVAMGDNNPGRWDFETSGSYPPSFKHGILWLETQEGSVIDLVAYVTDANTGDWLVGQGLAPLSAAAAEGFWPSTSSADAFSLASWQEDYGTLADPLVDGNSAGDWTAQGGSSEGYYDRALGLTGEALKSALNSIIKGHTVVDYGDLLDVFHLTDPDPENPEQVIQFYTRQSTTSNYNREHLWAKSHGGFDSDSEDGYSDLHHMRPTRPDVNNVRWHLDFAEGGDLYSDTDCRVVSNYSFEPPDEVKGDVARSLFYMAVRYEGDDSNMPDLELVDEIPSLLNELGEPDNTGTEHTPRHGKLSTLLEWNVADPPDEQERARNEVIYSQLQGNRNPFIDHPEWVEEIWGGPAWP